MNNKLESDRLPGDTILKSIGEAVIATDAQGRIIYMNPAAETLAGRTQQDVLGQAATNVFPIVSEETHLPIETKLAQEDEVINLEGHDLLMTRTGAGIPVVGSIAPIRDESGNVTGVVWVLRSDTEKRQSRQALQEIFEKVERAKREWESTVDALPGLVCLMDEQGYLIRANRTIEAWHLGQVTDVKGRRLHELLHPQCVNPACYLDLFLKQATEQAGQLAKQEAFDPVLGRHVLINVCPVHGRDGSASWAVVVALQDITERKQAEQERERLIQELDAFAHTVAHDLRNPVGVIIGFAELEYGYSVTSNDELRQSLQVIARVARKLNNIIDELLLLAGVRQTEVETRPLDMPSIVAEAQQRLIDLIHESEARIVLPDIWPEAWGHAPWVEEVWMNYLSNAIKYGGQPPYIELGATVQADGMVRFWVLDNGPGLTPEEQNRMFIPFTRLGQARATGHGLGLSIVRRIVEKLGGQAGVESNNIPGQGSKFYFTLPGCRTPAP